MRPMAPHSSHNSHNLQTRNSSESEARLKCPRQLRNLQKHHTSWKTNKKVFSKKQNSSTLFSHEDQYHMVLATLHCVSVTIQASHHFPFTAMHRHLSEPEPRLGSGSIQSEPNGSRSGPRMPPSCGGRLTASKFVSLSLTHLTSNFMRIKDEGNPKQEYNLKLKSPPFIHVPLVGYQSMKGPKLRCMFQPGK